MQHDNTNMKKKDRNRLITIAKNLCVITEFQL